MNVQTADEFMNTDLDAKPYWVYLLECLDGSYYAGVALDVERRFVEHVLGMGAAYTRARPPLRVLAAGEYPSKGAALSAEYALKQLPKKAKINFFESCELAFPCGTPS